MCIHLELEKQRGTRHAVSATYRLRITYRYRVQKRNPRWLNPCYEWSEHSKVRQLQVSEGSCWVKMTCCRLYTFAPHRRVAVLTFARSLLMPYVTLLETDTVVMGRRSFVSPRRLLLVGFFFEIPFVLRASHNDLKTGCWNNIVFPAILCRNTAEYCVAGIMAMM